MEAPPPAGCGDSDKWVITPWQQHKEELIKQYTGFDQVHARFPEHVKTRVYRRWIEYAYQNGDLTYKLFTGGKPIYPPYVTYHHLVDAPMSELEQVAKLITSGRGLDHGKAVHSKKQSQSIKKTKKKAGKSKA